MSVNKNTGDSVFVVGDTGEQDCRELIGGREAGGD